MKYPRTFAWMAIALLVVLVVAAGPAAAQKQPNIVVIMGDDVGMWNLSAYHRGMMGGRTPNIDRIANEGALFTDYYAQQSCTAGRAAFILGQTPFRTGLLKVGMPAANRRSPEAPRLRHGADRQESPRRP
jgi:arylsulfatase